MIMTDIDAALARLREMPVHPGLGSIDAAILDGIAAGVRQPLSGSVVGMAGSLIPGASVTAAPVAPFGASPALAPSTLLGGGE